MKTRREMIGRKQQFFSKNGYPKVLIGTPLAEHKYYCINDFIKNVKQLDYPDVDFVLVDNSKNPSAIDTLKEFNPDVRVEYSGFYDTTRASQKESYQLIRKIFLEGDYDYLFTLESDLFPHEGIIQELMGNDVDICGAVYWLPDENREKPCFPCVTTGKFAYAQGMFREGFMIPNEISGELHNILGGCGLGCTLIKRKVIEALEFRHDLCHADTYFHRDAHRKGFKTFVDTRFVIPHYPSAYPDYF